MKNCRLELRLSESEFDIIQKTACKYDLAVSKFILSVLIPYCVNADRPKCKFSVNGICSKFSDSTFLQPCIDGPCGYEE